jgi:hypothetical protein
MAAATTSDKFKFPEPREFDGKKRNAETWILRLEEYFGARGVQLTNDRDRVRYALFRLGAEAEAWGDAELRKYTAATGTWPPWVDFKKTFITRWGESNIAAKALGKLKQYKWKRHPRDSINEILTTVDTLIQEAKIADEDQKKSFLREALPPKYQNFLAYARIDTYENSLTALAEFETELDRTPAAGGEKSSGPRNEWAMDVDRVKINQFGADKKKGPCFNCGKEGHWASNCFLKKDKDKIKYKSKYKHDRKHRGRSSRFKKGKKRYIRGVNAEEDSDSDSSLDEESSDEEDEEVSIGRLKSKIDGLDWKERKALYRSLAKDF